MGPDRPENGIDELVERWRDARSVVVLTGAGLSTDSGIPDFRSPGGRWESYRPVTLGEFESSEASRRTYWRYKGETWQVIRDARPNPAHDALAVLAQAGRIDLLATQNVDGLHERSGFPPDRLVNVHGTDAEVACLRCGRREPREAAQREWESGVAVPRCPCGAPWKPATISFGQALVEEDLERAFRAAGSCDVFVAAGTSLVVGPINRMFEVAHGAGAFTAILTASETPFDRLARAGSGGRLRDVLPRIARAVLSDPHRTGLPGDRRHGWIAGGSRDDGLDAGRGLPRARGRRAHRARGDRPDAGRWAGRRDLRNRGRTRVEGR